MVEQKYVPKSKYLIKRTKYFIIEYEGINCGKLITFV